MGNTREYIVEGTRHSQAHIYTCNYMYHSTEHEEQLLSDSNLWGRPIGLCFDNKIFKAGYTCNELEVVNHSKSNIP